MTEGSWETVGEGIVRLLPGETVQGTYVEKRSTFEDQELPNPIHVLKNSEGQEVGVWASWDLDRKLEGRESREVRITFVAERETGKRNDDGSKQTVKDYRVQVRVGS